ncbi:MAG: thioredoxin family protein [Negativicutes bacterium]|nr:thioredoxin family protein [Negativicutes bacterium]
MKPMLMFIMDSCPHCKKALAWMEELKQEIPQYADIEVNIVDEKAHPDIANQYDYYYVPTYYIAENKVHEGAATKDIVRKVFAMACE